jgi:hypothetical protein
MEKIGNLECMFRLSFQPLISSQPAVFFSHNKLANSTFSRLFSAKRTGWQISVWKLAMTVLRQTM